jgi:trehalose-phosphatase
MNAPRHALQGWNEIARRIHQANRLFLFTDFDGTLAPIRRHPGQVWLSPRVKRLLGNIVHSGVIVGIASGRKLADLRRRVGLNRIWYVGVHGYFLRDRGNRSITLLTPKHRRQMKDLSSVLIHRLHGLPGIWVEPKLASVAVHFRGAPMHSERLARRAVAAFRRKYPKMSFLSGKKVWEWLPDSRTDKWRALSLILRRERRNRGRGGQLAIYLGDDATDERVFRKLKGVSIAVGKKRRTAAEYYLRSPAEVRSFLFLLRQACE